MFVASLTGHLTLVGVAFKYLSEAMIKGVPFGDVLQSIMQMLVIGELPDFIVSTLPLFFNYARLAGLLNA